MEIPIPPGLISRVETERREVPVTEKYPHKSKRGLYLIRANPFLFSDRIDPGGISFAPIQSFFLTPEE